MRCLCLVDCKSCKATDTERNLHQTEPCHHKVWSKQVPRSPVELLFWQSRWWYGGDLLWEGVSCNRRRSMRNGWSNSKGEIVAIGEHALLLTNLSSVYNGEILHRNRITLENRISLLQTYVNLGPKLWVGDEYEISKSTSPDNAWSNIYERDC